MLGLANMSGTPCEPTQRYSYELQKLPWPRFEFANHLVLNRVHCFLKEVGKSEAVIGEIFGHNRLRSYYLQVQLVTC